MEKNLVKCAVLLVLMVVFMIGATVVTTGTGALVGLSILSMLSAMYFWYRFAAPRVSF